LWHHTVSSILNRCTAPVVTVLPAAEICNDIGRPLCMNYNVGRETMSCGCGITDKVTSLRVVAALICHAVSVPTVSKMRTALSSLKHDLSVPVLYPHRTEFETALKKTLYVITLVCFYNLREFISNTASFPDSAPMKLLHFFPSFLHLYVYDMRRFGVLVCLR
jgi:hypothetical protein